MIFPWMYIILSVSILIPLFVAHVILKSHLPLLSAFKSSLGGIIALLAVNLASGFTGVFIPLSILNIGISSLGGIPGICTILVLNLIFK